MRVGLGSCGSEKGAERGKCGGKSWRMTHDCVHVQWKVLHEHQRELLRRRGVVRLYGLRFVCSGAGSIRGLKQCLPHSGQCGTSSKGLAQDTVTGGRFVHVAEKSHFASGNQNRMRTKKLRPRSTQPFQSSCPRGRRQARARARGKHLGDGYEK